jgi:methyl-accepting chemotaxis protein
MRWFNDIKIGKKLIGAFIFLAAISSLLVGVVGIYNINSINEKSQKIYSENLVPLKSVYKIETDYLKMRMAVRDVALSAEGREKYLKKISELEESMSSNMEEYSKNLTSKDEENNYKNITSYIKEYLKTKDDIISKINSNNIAGAMELMNGQGATISNNLDEAIGNAFKVNTDQAEGRNNENASGRNTALFIMLGIVLLAVVFSSVIGSIIAQSISRPVNKLLAAANSIAVGNLDVDIDVDTKDEVGVLAKAFRQVILSVRSLTSDANMLAQAAIEGLFETRADVTKHQGEYRRIVEGVNATLDTVVDKTVWYESIIDAVPFPIHVTDNNMKWTYMNKAFEKLMIDGGVLRERKDGYGKACSNAGANICNTANCGIKQLQKGVPVSYFDWCGMNCKQDTSYLKNKNGESVGYVEVVTDLTSILRVSDYNKLEIERLAVNLDLLAKGDMNLDLSIKAADEYTEEAYQNFSKINNNLDKAGKAVKELINDTLMLSDAAVEGRLDARADALKHHGDFRRIVEGVNATMDAVIQPLSEAQNVMKLMSMNDFTINMTGQYKGILKEFAKSINDVHNRLVFIQEAMVDLSRGDTSKLEEIEKSGKKSENDKLAPAFIGMMRAIQGLTTEAGKLAEAAISGELDVRGDAGSFEGGYREIIEGMNRTMKAVSEPLKEVGAILIGMEKGDLTQNMVGSYQGNYGVLKEAVNSTVETFNEVLNEINTSAQQVASGARQVSDSAQILSQGSTEQASSVEELTASLEQVAVQTKQNAINANEANELAITAKENAIQGNSQMSAMLKAMEEINESSGNISKIIKVIDDIAFQTNILALNAAVEAARAGQHGKGFAVVAEEVRNLAARSANAAKETTGLIEGSIKKAEGGTKIANETAVALNKIVEGVAKAATLVGGIAAASDEQAAAISQINQGIMQVSQVTQTNSATSEESAAASEELSGQAQILNEMVGKFKLKKGSSRLKGLEEISPEILEMLEGMKEKKKTSTTYEKKSEPSASRMKIALSDNEFGKY